MCGEEGIVDGIVWRDCDGGLMACAGTEAVVRGEGRAVVDAGMGSICVDEGTGGCTEGRGAWMGVVEAIARFGCVGRGEAELARLVEEGRGLEVGVVGIICAAVEVWGRGGWAEVLAGLGVVWSRVVDCGVSTAEREAWAEAVGTTGRSEGDVVREIWTGICCDER